MQDKTAPNTITDLHSGGDDFLAIFPLPAHVSTSHLAIADMADAFGVTHRTLHFYEEKGLLSAQRVGPMRVYAPSDVRRMSVINACREIDMPIAEIQDLMKALDGAMSRHQACMIFEQALHQRKRELAAQQANLRRQMQRIGELIETVEDGGEAQRSDAPPVHLSPIELKCLSFMAEGYTATRIASLMDMDMTAVLTLEAGIIRKFNGHNRFQAVAKAVLMGLVEA